MSLQLAAALVCSSLLLSPLSPGPTLPGSRARVLALAGAPPPSPASDPDFRAIVADAEAFLEAEGLFDEAGGGEAGSGPPPRRAKKRRRVADAPKKPPKPSKVSKLRVGCYGCGADLQTEVPAAAGYVEPERYELKAQHRQLKLLLCTRCRSLSHGEILPAVVEGRLRAATAPATAPEATADADAVATDTAAAATATANLGIGVTTPEQLRAELAPLRDQKILAVLLVDVTDVTGSFLPRVRDLIGGNPIVLVGTKLDLLPKGTNPDAVLAWLYERLSPRLNVIGAHLISARTGEGVNDAAQAILRERKGRDTFILGAANVGKSLFVGSFLEEALGGRGRRLPISSPTPGTTLRLIGLDCFEGGSMLFDTPGLHLPHRLSATLLPDELRAILPRGRMTPYTPSPSGPLAGTSYFWGGLVRIDVIEAPLCARFTFVSAYTLRVGEVAGGPEAAQREYDAQVGVTLTPPLSVASAAQLGALEVAQRVELDLREMEQAADISISGLGWISVGALASLRRGGGGGDGGGDGMRCVLDVWAPRGVLVSLRPPMPVTRLSNDVTTYDDVVLDWDTWD